MDDVVEPKSHVIEVSVDVKPFIDPCVDVKPFSEACVEVKSSGVSKLRDNDVNTASFFTKDGWRVRDDLLDWVLRQAVTRR